MLTVKDLAVAGVAPFNFVLADGECIALSGASGSGKSLLLRAIADLDPNSGQVILDGVIRENLPAPLWRTRVVYLAAESGWWADIAGSHFADREAAAGLISRLGLAPPILDQPVARLSTGERQRLALVRGFGLQPRVMLLDEPTAALDVDSARGVEAVLGERLSAGMSAILVTHDRGQAIRLAGRQFRIADGVVTRVTP